MKLNPLFLSVLLLLSLSALAKGKLEFIPNKGQWNGDFQYKADLQGGAVFFTPNRFVFNYFDIQQVDKMHEEKHHDHKDLDLQKEMVNWHAISMDFLNSNKNVKLISNTENTNYYNYFLGNNPNQWKTKIHSYNSLRYENIYDGIDIVVKSELQSLKYDFVISPLGNPAHIKAQFQGVNPKILANGNLQIQTSVNEYEEAAPIAFQIINGKKVDVPCKFKLSKNILHFSLPQGYDVTQELTIDPVLIFKTYSGSTSTTYGWSATYDLTGKFYSGGESFGTGWPVSPGASQMAFGGSVDCGINVYTSNGSSLIYSTYYGGTLDDLPCSLIVEPLTNNLIIFGTTNSTNLPLPAVSLYATNAGNQDIFLAKFNNTGTSLLSGTYLGGSSYDGLQNQEINLAPNGNILLASGTSSNDFPLSANAAQSTYGGGSSDGIFAVLNNNLSTLLYSSYVGGNDDDYCYSAVTDNNNNYFLCGETNSPNFVSTPGAFQTTNAGLYDGFLRKYNSNFVIQASTLIGGTGSERGNKIQIGVNNDVYVLGSSDNTNYITPSTGLYNNTNGNMTIHRFNNQLTSLVEVTKFGSIGSFSSCIPSAFLIDLCGNIYVSCFGANTMPVTVNATQSTPSSLFMFVFNGNLNSLLYGSYMGALGDHIDGGSSRFDPNGIIYQSVCTNSGTAYAGFPGAYASNKLSSSYDISSFKIDFQFSGVTAQFNTGTIDTFCFGDTIIFNNTSVATSYQWDLGDGTTDTVANPKHLYAAPGSYTIRLIAMSIGGNGCNNIDTIQYIKTVRPVPNISSIIDSNTCVYSNHVMDVSISNPDSLFTYIWTPATYLNNTNTLNPTMIKPLNSVTYTLTVSTNGVCSKSIIAPITVLSGFNFTPSKDTICDGSVLNIIGSGHPKYNYTWLPNTALSSSNTVATSIGSLPVGNYIYTLTASFFGCPDSIKTVQVSVIPKTTIILPNDTTICEGDVLSIDALITPSVGWYAYQWTPALAVTQPFGPITTFTASTTQTLTLSVNNFACSPTTESIIITRQPKADFAGNTDTSICKGEKVTLNTQITDYDITPFSNYTIDPINPKLVHFMPANSTTYSISTNEYCVDTNQFLFFIEVSTLPVATIIPPNQLINTSSNAIFNTSAYGNLNYTWFDDGLAISTSASVSLNNMQQGQKCLVLVIEDQIGCIDSGQYCFNVLGYNTLSVPSAFTPNGDGINETLKVISKFDQEIDMKIYSRFGQLIKEFKNTTDVWDGKFKGQYCETDTYFYILKFTQIDGEEIVTKGNFHIIK